MPCGSRRGIDYPSQVPRLATIKNVEIQLGMVHAQCRFALPRGRKKAILRRNGLLDTVEDARRRTGHVIQLATFSQSGLL